MTPDILHQGAGRRYAGTMDYDRFTSERLLQMLDSAGEPVALAIGLHLLVEHGVNYLISQRASSEAAVTDRLIELRFPKKTKLAFDLGTIPKELYDNHLKLNKIRNEYAHNLDFDLSSLEPNRLYFTTPPNENFEQEEGFAIGDLAKTLSNPPTNSEILNVLSLIGVATFAWQHNLIVNEYLE